MGAVSSRARESWRRWRAKVWIFLGGDVERHPGPGQEAQAAARRCALRIVREQYDDMWAGLRRAYSASMVRIEEQALLEGEQRWEAHLEGEQLWAAGLRDELRRIVNIRAGLPSRRAWRTIETAEVARLAGQQEAEEEEDRQRALDQEQTLEQVWSEYADEELGAVGAAGEQNAGQRRATTRKSRGGRPGRRRRRKRRAARRPWTLSNKDRNRRRRAEHGNGRSVGCGAECEEARRAEVEVEELLLDPPQTRPEVEGAQAPRGALPRDELGCSSGGGEQVEARAEAARADRRRPRRTICSIIAPRVWT